MSRILLVEDDRLLQQTLHDFLQGKKVSVTCATTCQQAREVFQPGVFDLVLLDRSLPDGDGLQLVSEYSLDTSVRFFVMSNLKGVCERLTGWRQGIDDYMEKPFSLEEWWWRVRRLLLVEKVTPTEEIVVGTMHFWPTTGIITVGSWRCQVRRREAALLHLLCKRLNQVVSRDEMVERIWRGADNEPTFATIDVYMRRLRIALGPAASTLVTHRGFGYRLQAVTSTG